MARRNEHENGAVSLRFAEENAPKSRRRRRQPPRAAESQPFILRRVAQPVTHLSIDPYKAAVERPDVSSSVNLNN